MSGGQQTMREMRPVSGRSFPGWEKLGWDHQCQFECDECDRDLFIEWLTDEHERILSFSKLQWALYRLRWEGVSQLYGRFVWMPTNIVRVVWLFGDWKMAWKWRWLHTSLLPLFGGPTLPNKRTPHSPLEPGP